MRLIAIAAAMTLFAGVATAAGHKDAPLVQDRFNKAEVTDTYVTQTDRRGLVASGGTISTLGPKGKTQSIGSVFSTHTSSASSTSSANN